MNQETKPAFNLLDEPWIPVRTLAGEVRDFSLTQVLLEGNQIAALAETSPPNLIALYRLLLAVLHRALTTHHGPWKDADRARWYREGLPKAPIRAYLGQWRERFWLFHPEYPFMQVAALADSEKTREKLKPWTQIALERSGSDTPLVFDHSLDSAPESAAYSSVLRSLLGYLQFAPGGLVKVFKTADYAGPLASSAAVMAVDSILARTLLLNLHQYSRDVIEDLPTWEKESTKATSILAAATLPSGDNDRYTRLTRSVLLVKSDERGLVTHLHFSEGIALDEDNRDPMICARVVDGEPRRVSFSEGRSIWRDLPSMVPDTSGKFDIQASCLAQATELRLRTGDEAANLTVIAGGWKNAPKKAAKVIRWRLDQIQLPQKLLQDPDCAVTLRFSIRKAETLFLTLKDVGTDMIAEAMPNPGHKDTKKRARAILDNGPTAAVFYSAAERSLPNLMQRIAAGDAEGAQGHWMAALKIAAQRAWEAARHSLGESPQALRAEARAYPRFRGLLRSLEQPNTATTPQEASA